MFILDVIAKDCINIVDNLWPLHHIKRVVLYIYKKSTSVGHSTNRKIDFERFYLHLKITFIYIKKEDLVNIQKKIVIFKCK